MLLFFPLLRFLSFSLQFQDFAAPTFQKLMAYAFQERKFTNCNSVFIFSVCFFVLKLSSRITEPAGLLPAQQDREQREEDEKPSRSDERKPNPREAL